MADSFLFFAPACENIFLLLFHLEGFSVLTFNSEIQNFFRERA